MTTAVAVIVASGRIDTVSAVAVRHILAAIPTVHLSKMTAARRSAAREDRRAEAAGQPRRWKPEAEG